MDVEKLHYFCEMIDSSCLKSIIFSILVTLPFIHGTELYADEYKINNFSPEKINLALRRTADALLRLSGDSTSRIPAIEQKGNSVWQVRLEQTFNYDQLPALLQSSLDVHGIKRPYNVSVRRCDDGSIDLGYNYLDFSENNGVACRGREKPVGCHYIEISFLSDLNSNPLLVEKGLFFLVIIGGIAGFWLFRRQKIKPLPAEKDTTNFKIFGNSQLDVTNQILLCNGVKHSLTFRETKLLLLFVTHSGQLMERDSIIQQVWADEGVLVGRSVDVFVSRLRKKLADDTSVVLAVVHGIGYRMEVL